MPQCIQAEKCVIHTCGITVVCLHQVNSNEKMISSTSTSQQLHVTTHTTMMSPQCKPVAGPPTSFALHIALPRQYWVTTSMVQTNYVQPVCRLVSDMHVGGLLDSPLLLQLLSQGYANMQCHAASNLHSLPPMASL